MILKQHLTYTAGRVTTRGSSYSFCGSRRKLSSLLRYSWRRTLVQSDRSLARSGWRSWSIGSKPVWLFRESVTLSWFFVSKGCALKAIFAPFHRLDHRLMSIMPPRCTSCLFRIPMSHSDYLLCWRDQSSSLWAGSPQSGTLQNWPHVWWRLRRKPTSIASSISHWHEALRNH